MLSRFERFAFTISEIHRCIQRIERSEMARRGLKGAYAQYLVAILRHPEGMTVAELCLTCEINKAAVSRAVGDMERQGLVQRRGSSNTVYRARLCLTETGRETAAYVHEKAQAVVEAAGREFTDEERELLYTALGRVATRLREIAREGVSLPEKQEGEKNQ